ncbi:MAG: hypothetical protein LBS16_00095 [Prevotellaceae bacterium]|jgi:hypothetical protein|nr:hypothetical protein [Prevotellaceae bacterium]
MKEKIEFYEKQYASLWLKVALTMLIVAIFMPTLISGIIDFRGYDLWTEILTVVVLLLVITLFWITNVELCMKSEGIFVKMFPFKMKYKFFAWENIEKAYLRKYSPLSEYGGWGVRVKLFSLKMFNLFGLKKAFFNETAYVISGNTGLQLELKNGKRVLISTQKPAEIEEILKKIEK